MKTIFWRRFVVATLSVLLVSGEFFVGFGVARAVVTPDITNAAVKINEVLFQPNDWVEKVELYNGGLTDVNLAGWSVGDEDGRAEHTFTDSIIFPRGSYLVIRADEGVDDTDFSDGQGVIYADHGDDYLNNNDQVALYNNEQQIVDFVAWGESAKEDDDVAVEAAIWGEGNYIDTAELQTEESIGLIADGVDNNDLADWKVFTEPTLGATNISHEITYSDQIRLNEILPNPSTSESMDEFIELYNASDEVVDLAGWVLGDASTNTYAIDAADFDSTAVNAGEYFVVYRAESGVALNNNGDSVKLYQPNEDLLNSMAYTESAKDDLSYNFTDDGWKWSIKSTPGETNIIETANNQPQADAGRNQSAQVGEKVTLDGGNSSDPDSDQLTCSWKFGDSQLGSGCTTTHAYSRAGSYTAELSVSDGRGGSDSDTVKITVTEKSGGGDDDGDGDGGGDGGGDNSDSETDQPTGPFSTDIILTEFLPNPAGSDTDDKGEFVEIHNKGAATVDLSSWQLDDEEGGSSPHAIVDNTAIKSGEYLAFYRGDTKLSINNGGDSVRILHPDGKVTDSATYEGKAEDGQAYARDEQGEWVWTTSPTPGEANKIDQPEDKDEDDSSTSTESTDSDTQSKDSTPTQKSDKDKKSEEAKTLTIKQAKAQAKNTEVAVAGVVTVPAKILSDTYLYIQDKTGGIQIYSSKKDFPDLKLGDQVKVSGKISEKSGEKKINISEQKDVSVTGSGNPPQPAFLSTGGVKEQFVGQLVKITGQLTKSSGNTFYVNDGSGELKISLQKSAGLKKPEWKKEDWVTITGVVGKTSSSLRVMPRYQGDLQAGKFAGGAGGKIPAAGAGGISKIVSFIIFLAFRIYQLLKLLISRSFSV